MRVELSREVLVGGGVDPLFLLGILAMGAEGRHGVLVEDRSAARDWYSRLPDDLADEIEYALEEGERVEALGPPGRVSVRVCKEGATWDGEPVQLSPIEAFSMLARPLRVVLENGTNDRCFLLAFANREQLRTIEAAEQQGWIEFLTAGGIDGALEVARSLCSEARHAVAGRTLVFTDSDARRAGAPSQKAIGVENALSEAADLRSWSEGRLGGVLRRRSAENYVPPGKLLAWACRRMAGEIAAELVRQFEDPVTRTNMAVGAKNTAHRDLCAALAYRSCDDEVRAHLDMKYGRQRGGTERTDVDLWSRLDPVQQAALHDGFGPQLSQDFFGSSSNLPDQSGEIFGYLRLILECM